MSTIPAVPDQTKGAPASAGVSPRKCDPVGAVEIAARLGVSRKTVDQWRQRNLAFPAPRWQVGGRPAWNWDEVQAWADARKSPTAPPR